MSPRETASSRERTAKGQLIMAVVVAVTVVGLILLGEAIF